MNFYPVGYKTPITKPDDLVRTPTGATGTIERILPGGRREVRLLNGELVELKADLLYLVRSAIPMPWPSRKA